MREGLQVIDREWRYLYLNRAAAEHGRRPAEELIGHTMMECYPGIDQTPVFELLRRAMLERASGAMRNEFSYPDGAHRTFELRVEPCEAGIVILSIDVTEALRVEAQLRHAQKMEAIGRLAGSVAHDFNNLLSVILSYSTLALEDLKPQDPLRDDLLEIQKAGRSAAELTTQLLAFSRQQVVNPRVVELNHVLKGSEALLRRLMGEDVEIVTRYSRSGSKIRVDLAQLDQVIMNLAVNARDAMPDGGKLTLEVRDVVLDDAYLGQHLGAQAGPYVMLAVSDTGIGMDKETQARIFEPFYTTKEAGRGTGLGLSTVFGIVQQNGGNIWVYSEVGGGTTFKIYLPRVEGPVTEVPRAVDPHTLEGTETILLVEDQDQVRQVAVEILRRLGYNVLDASSAGEALLTCERHPRKIQLLLTDVVMPHMSGRELADRLLKLRPEIKVLYMSGYTENSIVHHGILDSGVDYLQKPIVPELLARRVREVLDRTSSRPPGA